MMHPFYKHRITGEIIKQDDLRQRFSNTSFPPHPWPNFVHDFINADPMVDTAPPTVDEFHIAVEDDYIQNEHKHWIKQWKIISKFTPEEEAKYKKDLIDLKWQKIRIERDRLLSETDFTEFSTTPISDVSRQNFIKYRQALRDLPQVNSDPYNIIWPDKPVFIKK